MSGCIGSSVRSNPHNCPQLVTLRRSTPIQSIQRTPRYHALCHPEWPSTHTQLATQNLLPMNAFCVWFYSVPEQNICIYAHLTTSLSKSHTNIYQHIHIVHSETILHFAILLQTRSNRVKCITFDVENNLCRRIDEFITLFTNN